MCDWLVFIIKISDASIFNYRKTKLTSLINGINIFDDGKKLN